MAAGALFLVSAITYLVLFAQGHHGLIDMQVYRAMGRNLRLGHNIYGPLKTPFHLRATYPPVAAMLFLPLSLVPLLVAKILVLGANLVWWWCARRCHAGSWASTRTGDLPQRWHCPPW
jgi:alpha-1,2-mannosyltransferase